MKFGDFGPDFSRVRFTSSIASFGSSWCLWYLLELSLDSFIREYAKSKMFQSSPLIHLVVEEMVQIKIQMTQIIQTPFSTLNPDIIIHLLRMKSLMIREL